MLDRKIVRALIVLCIVVLHFLLNDDSTWISNSGGGRTVGASITKQLSTQKTYNEDVYSMAGRIVDVVDGDTLKLKTGPNGHQSVRLDSIDAPERESDIDRPGQPFGVAAKQFLSENVKGKDLKLQCYEKDLYGRHICDVPHPDIAGSTMNQALVEAGLAWANMENQGQFLRDQSLLDLQKHAQSQGLGIWSEKDPIEPWVWRYQCWRKGKC